MPATVIPGEQIAASAEGQAERSVDWLYSLVMGVVEGLTEFLPVSSTGHLIVTSRVFEKPDSTFEIAIQLGAISAILFLYRQKLWTAARHVLRAGEGGRMNLLWLIALAALPAAVLGLLFEDIIDAYLFNNTTVAVALIVGGVLLWLLEGWQRRRQARAGPGAQGEATDMMDMRLRQALAIGCFQTLALIPGTSRAGATIAGGMILGFKRSSAAEFSFLVGLPILYGASLLKLTKRPEIFEDSTNLWELGIAMLAAFVSAAVVVGPFVRFLQAHSFVPFAIYRILAGLLLLVLVWSGFFESGG